MFVCGNALEDFQSKSGTFCEAKELFQVATEVFVLARSLILRTSSVFFVGVPPRGTKELQKKVLELNTSCNLQKQPILFVEVSHY